MENTSPQKNNSKMAKAIQDAALLNINEDIQAIHDNLEKIIIEIPEQARQQVSTLREEILSLEAALKSVPEQFDLDFSRKINRVLDVVSELESNTKKLNNTIHTDNSAHITKQAVQFAEKFNKKIDDYHSASSLTLFIYGMGSAIFGGAMAGMIFLLYFKFYL